MQDASQESKKRCQNAVRTVYTITHEGTCAMPDPSTISLPADLNYVDVFIVVVLAVGILNGMRRGCIAGALDLSATVLAVLAALKFYPFVAAWIVLRYAWPRGLVNLGTLIVLFFMLQAMFGALAGVLHRALWPVRTLLKPLDILLGAIPGAVSSLITLALILTPLALYPLIPELRETILSSQLGAPIVRQAERAAPAVERFLGQAAEDTLMFFTVPRRERSPTDAVRLGFPPNLPLSPDPAAEERMLELINQERARHGLPPLVMDPLLREVARRHSEEMFRLSYFSHSSPVTGSPADRLNAAGVRYTVAGENLAYAPAVQVAHDGLMNSPDHRKNILSPDFSRVGIGVIQAGIYGKMFTQEFAN
jgi:uncharacterized protein YkwD